MSYGNIITRAMLDMTDEERLEHLYGPGGVYAYDDEDEPVVDEDRPVEWPDHAEFDGDWAQAQEDRFGYDDRIFDCGV